MYEYVQLLIVMKADVVDQSQTAFTMGIVLGSLENPTPP